uniref:Uncharacterized protein n=1 Tax=Arundo donax TaxID=35708 RepID=A0A0A9HBQ5_ARUDO
MYLTKKAKKYHMCISGTAKARRIVQSTSVEADM